VDFYAAYKINKNADISFKVTNLFDKEYTPALSSYGSGQGRTFVVATQFQF
jgi:hemoglobin/transferrin/lactoferrin receptor protein